jgi:anti-sigma factor (TIGR02949 family)
VNRVTCEEAFRQLDDYLDRQLRAGELRLIEEHLEICAACLREFTFEQSVLDGVRKKLREVTAPPGLMARIAAALRSW